MHTPQQTLDVLRRAKEAQGGSMVTKSSIMLGLGETAEEALALVVTEISVALTETRVLVVTETPEALTTKTTPWSTTTSKTRKMARRQRTWLGPSGLNSTQMTFGSGSPSLKMRWRLLPLAGNG